MGAWRLSPVVAGALCAAAAAHATLVPLENVFSTGQAAQGSVDPNYYIITTPDVYPKDPNWKYADVTSANAYVAIGQTDPYGWPFAGAPLPWVTYGIEGEIVRWVAPQPNYTDATQHPDLRTDAEGIWVYQTRFYIQAGVDPATALLYGAISSDNCTLSVLINGVPVSGWGMTPGRCLADLHYFQIGGPQAVWTTDVTGGLELRTTSYISGWNTISFEVLNNYPAVHPNPSGLCVWLDSEGDLTGVPEPASGLLIVAGLAGLALWRRHPCRDRQT